MDELNGRSVPRMARHMIFLRAQLLTPFGVRFDYPGVRGGIAVLGEIQDVGPFQHRDIALMISLPEKLLKHCMPSNNELLVICRHVSVGLDLDSAVSQKGRPC
jgi:hypothetical protein